MPQTRADTVQRTENGGDAGLVGPLPPTTRKRKLDALGNAEPVGAAASGDAGMAAALAEAQRRIGELQQTLTTQTAQLEGRLRNQQAQLEQRMEQMARDHEAALDTLRRTHAVELENLQRVTDQLRRDAQAPRPTVEQGAGAGPAEPAAMPMALRDPKEWYPFDIPVNNPPSTQDDINRFYALGGKEQDHVWVVRAGCALRRFTRWDPDFPIERAATPVGEQRYAPLDAAAVGGNERWYFEVNRNDAAAAQAYGLRRERKAGSRWEGETNPKVQNVSIRHYSEDPAVKIAAFKRFPRVDITNGQVTHVQLQADRVAWRPDPAIHARGGRGR